MSLKDERSPFAQRGFVASAAAVGVVALLAVVVILSGGSSGRSQGRGPGAHSPGTTAVHSIAPAVHKAAGCDVAAGSQQVPTTAPAAGWALVGSMAAPSNPRTTGPQRTVDGFRTCFARSPLGSLYAVVNFWAAGTAFSPATVYEHLAADTASRRQVIAQAQGGAPRLDSSGPVQVAGFEFNSYSPTSTDLSLVLEGSSGVLVSVACTMVWQHGDWRYVIPPSGAPAAGQVQDLDGYVPWTDAS